MSEDSQAFYNHLSTISHELRTPLNAIIGYSELLLEDHGSYDEATMKADLRRIHHAGRHLLGLIDEVVDVARLESGQTEVFRETVEVAKLVHRLLPTLTPMAANGGNHFEWTIEPGVRLRTDPKKLTTVIRALVNRAGRVTSEGRIELAIEQVDDQVLIRVSDTGENLDPEQLAQSFTTFEGGKGRGFSSASRLIELLGGTITTDTTGQGTSFTVRLLALDLPTSEEPVFPEVEEGSRVVLVVDDDPTVHDLMRRHLEHSDCVVLSAMSGPEALRIADRYPPVVIALDVNMPEMDGWSTLARLRAQEKLADIPVIMMSMLDDDGRALSLGVSEYLTKPIERPTLLSTVERFVSGQRPRVLIVDDEDDARDLTRRVLMGAGYLVDEVSDGTTALKYLAEEQPDLVLLDLMMPGIDGFTVLKKMREDLDLTELPVIVLTSMTLTPADRARLAEGAASVIKKDASTDVIAQLKDLLDKPS